MKSLNFYNAKFSSAALAWLMLLCARASGIEALPKFEAYFADGSTIVITLELPEGALSLEQAESLYGQPGRGFVRLDLSGSTYTGSPGSPSLPMISAAIDAPIGAEAKLTVEPGDFVEIRSTLPVIPATQPSPKIFGFSPVFNKDHRIYSADARYPGTLGELYDASAHGGLARGHRLMSVRLYPIQYNPITGMIRIYRRLTARIEFNGGDWPANSSSVLEKGISRDWDEMVGRLCLSPLKRHPDFKLSKAGDLYFDIFYGSSFQTAAKRFADWKSRLGYKVRLSDAGGWTAQAIRDSIRFRQPAATYVILISDPNAGGLDSLPTSGSSYTGGFKTDLYYSELDGTGYLPDLFLGRISVRTPAEAEIAVDKIIGYQQGDFGSAGYLWLGKALFIAGYDASFQWLGRSTNRYCHDILKREGYTEVDTLVMASGEEQDRIVARLNQGRAWAVYTAHGSSTGWSIGGSSSFTSDEVTSLVHNDDRPAMVSGHCCLSNNFTYSSGDCFGEAWPKLDGRGAVAYFGSVPLTYWDEDDWLQRRYFDAIYDSVPGTPGLRMTEPGRYTQYGLFWIDLNTNTSLKQYYFEAYHLLGDPSAPIWTGTPKSLAVEHPPIARPQADTMNVTVYDSATGQPAPGALVCVWSRSQPTMHRTAFSGSDGVAFVPMEPCPIGDTLLVTASLQGYRPYLSQALVMAKLNVVLSSRTIVINVPTQISLRVTDPDSGDAPVCSLEVYASQNDGAPSQVATTDSDGRASFTLCPNQGGYVALSGRRTSVEMFRDTIRVLTPESFQVTRAFPNPSAGAVIIDFQMPRSGMVEIRAYNVAGQLVETVFSGSLPAGYHRLGWDGCDRLGRRLPSGVYLLTLGGQNVGRTPTRRLVLIR